MRRRWLVLLIGWAALFQVLPVYAHANLVRSTPAANEHLATSPQEIRLWFSEPVEPQFSQIEIRNAQGEVVDTPPAQVDPDDGRQFVLTPGSLPDGVYTVAWHVISQTDGHPTQGNFPFAIGAVAGLPQPSASLAQDESIPVASAAVRWLNLLSLALMLGSAAFWLFVWQLSVPDGSPLIEARMRRVIGLGWLAVGLTSGLLLLMQAALVSGPEIARALANLPQMIARTRFGALWLVRVGLWLVFGAVLRVSNRRASRTYAGLLLIGVALLAVQSLFSHASGAADTTPSVIADWMHLLAMAFWVGGLAQFVIVIGPVRQLPPVLSQMVARFSNMARVAVAMLIVTGLYAAWLQVGTLEALLTTSYGRALIGKLVLLGPLLALGAVNLILTSRGLRSGKIIWSQRLRAIVSLEIILATAILAAVGVMTTIAPARVTAALEAAPPPEGHSFFQMNIQDGMMIHLSIEPGMVGENTFHVDLYDQQTGQVIDNASLIRLRMESRDQSIGESELRPTLDADGRYSVSGSNLSLPGDWRVRLTIQRPNEFDTVSDFEATIAPPPAPVEPAYHPPVDVRVVALVLTGFAGIVVSGLSLWLSRPAGRNPLTVFAAVFLAGSVVIWLSGVLLLYQ